MKRAWLAASVFLLTSLSAQEASSETAWRASLSSPEVFQGGVAEVRVDGRDLASVKGLFRGRVIPFFPSEPDSYSALVGVDLDEKPGSLSIAIHGMGKNGEGKETILTFRIKAKAFPQETLSVPSSFDRIDEAIRKRIEREQTRMDRLWKISSAERFWEGRFIKPVRGGITSPFGLRRIINGLPRLPHGGVDLKAPLGAKVAAANHGQVALRDDFFFSGKSLVLDHGGGLYTMYFHLADFHVEQGARVRKGDVIGLVGMTGRVTGPHLHWGARLTGARVDPFELLAGASPTE